MKPGDPLSRIRLGAALLLAGCGEPDTVPKYHQGQMVCMVLNDRCAMVLDAGCYGHRCTYDVRMKTMDEHGVVEFEIAGSCEKTCRL
jgi:hypothetical protein